MRFTVKKIARQMRGTVKPNEVSTVAAPKEHEIAVLEAFNGASEDLSIEDTDKPKKAQKQQKKENKLNENIQVMDTKDKIELAAEVLEMQSQIKKIKNDKGLIERTESSKIILTEDNRELLID